MGGTGSVIAGAARRRGAEAMTRAGRPEPRITPVGELADSLADRLEQEGHELAFTARQVAKGVHEHERARLAAAQRG